MPRNDLHTLIGLVLVLVTVFVIMIVLGLRLARRSQAQTLRNTCAAGVLAEIGANEGDRAALLYGVWRTSMREAVLLVRDGNDNEVASIVHRLSGAVITAGNQRYAVTSTSRWRESALLTRADNDLDTSVLASFERRGWITGVASYLLPDRHILSIRFRGSLSWKRKPQSILQDGEPIGQLFALGGATRNTGRAVLLPPTMALPIRLFVLYKAAGTRTASVAS